MGSRELFASVFHFPAGITMDSIDPSANELVMRVACDFPSMPCPECQQPCARIHSRNPRLVADLPCAGRNVLLMLTVRKFVCSSPTCPRKITTRAPARAGRILWTHDLAAHRACTSPWVRSRWANGHAPSRPIRHRHHPVHLVTPCDAVACSADTSGAGPWG